MGINYGRQLRVILNLRVHVKINEIKKAIHWSLFNLNKVKDDKEDKTVLMKLKGK